MRSLGIVHYGSRIKVKDVGSSHNALDISVHCMCSVSSCMVFLSLFFVSCIIRDT
jgi:hypothetical protein